MRILGIDFGERRIGLAVSDDEGRWALPLATIERHSDRRAAYRIAEIARRHGAAALVLGEPLGLDGSAGEAAERVRRFGQRLERAAKLPLYLVNEALTTVEASERLSEAGLDCPKHPRRDAVAAQILLQEALDRNLAAGAGSCSSAEPMADVLPPLGPPKGTI